MYWNTTILTGQLLVACETFREILDTAICTHLSIIRSFSKTPFFVSGQRERDWSQLVDKVFVLNTILRASVRPKPLFWLIVSADTETKKGVFEKLLIIERWVQIAVSSISRNFDWTTFGCMWNIPRNTRHSNLHPSLKSADFYPPNPRFRYFFGFFWLGCLEILVLSMPISLEAMSVQKSPKMPLWKFLTFFWLFFFLFSKMAADRVKMIFQTPKKGSTCFKHHKFLNFDKKKYPQKFYTTDFKISLVPCSYKRWHF